MPKVKAKPAKKQPKPPPAESWPFSKPVSQKVKKEAPAEAVPALLAPPPVPHYAKTLSPQYLARVNDALTKLKASGLLAEADLLAEVVRDLQAALSE